MQNAWFSYVASRSKSYVKNKLSSLDYRVRSISAILFELFSWISHNMFSSLKGLLDNRTTHWPQVMSQHNLGELSLGMPCFDSIQNLWTDLIDRLTICIVTYTATGLYTKYRTHVCAVQSVRIVCNKNQRSIVSYSNESGENWKRKWK